jgi:hypothetical protein
VERLTSRKRTIREATLQWLEAAARAREPEYMLLSGHTELLPLVKATQVPEPQVPVIVSADPWPPLLLLEAVTPPCALPGSSSSCAAYAHSIDMCGSCVSF